MHSPHNHPDIETDAFTIIKRERDRAHRTIRTIRALIPPETFRPKNADKLPAILQRVHNELLRYEKGTH